jgi:hypothetical protein
MEGNCSPSSSREGLSQPSADGSKALKWSQHERVQGRRHSVPAKIPAPEDFSLQESPDKPKDFSHAQIEKSTLKGFSSGEKQEDLGKSSQKGTEKADSKPEAKMFTRRESKMSTATTATGPSSQHGSDESDYELGDSVDGSLQHGTDKSGSLDNEKADRRRRTSTYSPTANEVESKRRVTKSSVFSQRLTLTYREEAFAISTKQSPGMCGTPGNISTISTTSTSVPQIDFDLASLQQDTDNSGFSDRASCSVANPTPVTSAAARGAVRVDLVAAEMQLLRDFAERILSVAEEKGVVFVQALNKAVCFGAACSGDREEILALCSFRRELTQLKDWAEQLTTLVGEEDQLIGDLTKVLEVIKGIQLSPLGSAGTLKSVLPDSDQLNQVARSMDLRDLASEMQRLRNLAKRINSSVEDKAVQLADSLNEAVTENTRAFGRDDNLMKFSMNIEADLKQLKNYAKTLGVFVENKKVISDLGRMGDLVKNIKVHLLRRS